MLYLKLFIKDIKNIPLYFKSMDFKSYIWFIKHPRIIRRWILYSNAVFKTSGGKTIMTFQTTNNSVSFYIKTLWDLNVIKDIFLNALYAVNLKKNAILIDVGLNIGTTSIFFANQKNIEHVYGFEPFKDTYEQALNNISLLSSDIANKITAFNYGLSDKDATIDVMYSSKDTGMMSVLPQNTENLINSGVKNVQKANVLIKSATKEIGEIISKTGLKIILKLDCEGSEFAILDSLSKNNILKCIDCILLEWHFKTPEQILDILSDNNFISFHDNIAQTQGMLYAVNQKN